MKHIKRDFSFRALDWGGFGPDCGYKKTYVLDGCVYYQLFLYKKIKRRLYTVSVTSTKALLMIQ